jgi:hypothetical protein
MFERLMRVLLPVSLVVLVGTIATLDTSRLQRRGHSIHYKTQSASQAVSLQLSWPVKGWWIEWVRTSGICWPPRRASHGMQPSTCATSS